MTISAAPLSKLRVTCLSCTAPLPQCAQYCSAGICSNDDEFAGEADFDDCFGKASVKRDAFNDALDFVRLSVALAGNDLPREDDVFEVEDSEVVIIKLFGCVG